MARILYVEDKPIARLAYATAFEMAGHEVTACPNYFVAKRVLAQQNAPYDLVVTDGRYEGDSRFGKRSMREGSLCLLADLKAAGAIVPVAILSMEPKDFLPDNLPPECLRPVAFYSKTEIDYYAMAAEVPKLLQMRPE